MYFNYGTFDFNTPNFLREVCQRKWTTCFLSANLCGVCLRLRPTDGRGIQRAKSFDLNSEQTELHAGVSFQGQLPAGGDASIATTSSIDNCATRIRDAMDLDPG